MSSVAEQRDNNEKLPGGVTGKGFMPGQSGNPTGRPKGSVSLKTRVRAILERMHDEQVDKQIADVIAETIVNGALDSAEFKGDKFLMGLLVEIEGSAKAEETDAHGDEQPKRIVILGSDARPGPRDAG